jgi:hypothetical protein
LTTPEAPETRAACHRFCDLGDERRHDLLADARVLPTLAFAGPAPVTGEGALDLVGGRAAYGFSVHAG